MKRIKYIPALIAAMCLLSDCITPYDIEVEGFRDLLVVEGIIIDGETTIQLSRSMPLNEEEGITLGARPVHNAIVWIEGDNGDRFDAVSTGMYSSTITTGVYVASDVVLSDDARYRLRISLDGEEYESDYRYPQSTPVIESLNFHPEVTEHGGEPYGTIQVRMNLKGGEGGSRYYLWNYRENWEINAYYNGPYYLGFRDDPDETHYSLSQYIDLLEDGISDNEPEPIRFPTWPIARTSPYYYCWKNNRSRELLLTTTDLLEENTLKDHVLYEIDVADDRLHSLYHTEISLYSIGQDAYFYFSNQKKNTDETGSIFAPIPSEMTGNIVSTTSPDVPVIGFVDVSRVVNYEAYLEGKTVPRRLNRMRCIAVTGTDASVIEANSEELGFISYNMYMIDYIEVSEERQEMIFAPRECMDCRQLGGSKTRPSWWPNDHY